MRNLHDDNLRRNINLAKSHYDKTERVFNWAFVLILIANLVVLGIVGWAIVELVQWITSK